MNAGVMELADVTDSKSVGLITRVGSNPATGTIIGLRGKSLCTQKRNHPIGKSSRVVFALYSYFAPEWPVSHLTVSEYTFMGLDSEGR